ncbi:MAG: MBL fold metallo-hydrolase [Clostridia bacterium]
MGIHKKDKRIIVVLVCMALACLPLCGCVRQDVPPAPVSTLTPTQTVEQPSLPAEMGKPGEATILFINVGKADAALVSIQGRNYLIDTGSKDSTGALFAALDSQGITQLDGVFITHTHSDHMGGLNKLAESYKINMLYCAQISMPNKKGEHKILNRATKLELPITALAAGDQIAAGQASFKVLGPLALDKDDDNDNSLVLRLSVNGANILFTGDMQFAEENMLLNAGAELLSDVLKVGNHGNPDATSDEFATAVSPRFAVISTDTTVDTDSANVRVKDTLAGAQMHITQDYRLGVRVTVASDGEINVHEGE